jgi:hypothetical protein
MAQRMKFHKTALFAIFLTSIFLSGFCFKAFAESDDSVGEFFGAKPTDFIKSRSYIGFLGTSSDIDQWGDFNGTNSLQSSSAATVSGGVTITPNPEVDFVPAITRKYGWGALVGQREGPWAVEVSFWRTDTTGSYSYLSGGATIIATTPASLQAINVDFKRYLFTELPTQPFISIGLSFPWLWVRNFSEILDYQQPPNPTTGQYNVISVNDETISGIGFNLGAGLEIYLDNNFSLIGGAYQRWTSFNQISGAAKIPFDSMYFDNNPSDVGSLEGDGLNLYVGTTFGFE